LRFIDLIEEGNKNKLQRQPNGDSFDFSPSKKLKILIVDRSPTFQDSWQYGLKTGQMIIDENIIEIQRAYTQKAAYNFFEKNHSSIAVIVTVAYVPETTGDQKTPMMPLIRRWRRQYLLPRPIVAASYNPNENQDLCAAGCNYSIGLLKPYREEIPLLLKQEILWSPIF
jgi:hypothetical protein